MARQKKFLACVGISPGSDRLFLWMSSFVEVRASGLSLGELFYLDFPCRLPTNFA